MPLFSKVKEADSLSEFGKGEAQQKIAHYYPDDYRRAAWGNPPEKSVPYNENGLARKLFNEDDDVGVPPTSMLKAVAGKERYDFLFRDGGKAGRCVMKPLAFSVKCEDLRYRAWDCESKQKCLSDCERAGVDSHGYPVCAGFIFNENTARGRLIIPRNKYIFDRQTSAGRAANSCQAFYPNQEAVHLTQGVFTYYRKGCGYLPQFVPVKTSSGEVPKSEIMSSSASGEEEIDEETRLNPRKRFNWIMDNPNDLRLHNDDFAYGVSSKDFKLHYGSGMLNRPPFSRLDGDPRFVESML